MVINSFNWVSPYHPDDSRGGWKGMQFHLLRALEKELGQAFRLAPIVVPENPVPKWTSRVLKRLGLPRSYAYYSERRLQRYSEVVNERLVKNSDLPVVFFGPLPFAHCRPKAPYFIYTDGSFFIHYWEYNKDHSHSRSEIERICRAEAEFMRASSAVWCSSKWVADRITAEYSLPTGLARSVGTGPGKIPAPMNPIIFEPSVVMIAADFERKRGRLAVEAVAAARGMGVNVQLKIIGQRPPDDVVNLPYVEWCGWLNLSETTDRDRYSEILTHAGAQILVSRSDLTPLVIPEAASYSKATIATDVGGIPEMIQDGVTGWLMPSDASAEEIGRLIHQAFSSRGLLEATGAVAKDYCAKHWSWESVGACCVKDIFRSR